jgi:L-2-hydroxyglutarate oxidase
LKARLCVEGNRRIRDFCREHNVPLREVGTLVVARSEAERPGLEELHRRGQANGVAGLRVLTGGELRAREPNARGCAALVAPTGAVLDSRCYVEALADEARGRGVVFHFGRRAERIEKRAGGHTVDGLRCRTLVNAAGLYADRIAHQLGAGGEYAILPFRGEYYRVRDAKAGLVRAMVYPVPDPDYPFLGIHWTPTADGGLKVGPNAVLALGREAYRRFQVDLRETLAMATDLRAWRLVTPSFLRLAARHLRTSLSRRAFLAEASTLVQGFALEDFESGPPPGNRAQLVDRRGRLVDDLVIERDGDTLHILNVVSPGLTCSLPFADHVASLLLD